MDLSNVQILVQACGAVIDFGNHTAVAVDFFRMLSGSIDPAQFQSVSDLTDPDMHATAAALIKDCMGTPP
jgi:hypothetical protein